MHAQGLEIESTHAVGSPMLCSMKAMARDATLINANIVPVLLSLETGTFPYRTTADTALSFTLYNIANLTPRRREKIVSLYKKTRVEERYFAIPDFLNEGGRTLLQRHRLVSLNDRLEQAGNTVLPLVTNVAKRALDAAEVNVDDVGQLVVVTSTALGSPGLEGKLVSCLGLRPNVLRACINYMGCGAGILGLRWASDFVKGLDSDRSDLVSLLICVEASSVHSTMAENQNSLVTHSLFSDGVACAVVRACSPSMPGVTGNLAVLDFESFMLEGTDDGIRLQMNADGIECLLSPRLPEAIESGVRLWLDSLLQRHRTKQEELSFWAIHPGGPKIIEKALEGLDLQEETACFSWETLRGYGNTLSCGVFYVLKKMLDGNAINPGDRGLAFSFSPGVSVEGVLLHALPAPSCQVQRERLKVKERRGAVIPSWVPDEIIERLGALDQRPDDVFVVTYPKAGTTWMLQIVHLLTNGGERGVLPLNRAVGWIERDGIAVLKAMPSPRIIKTHLPLPLLVPTEGRWIYVARNPKDLAVSYYYHARAKVDFDFLGTWDRFFELLEGQVEGGDWWEHTAAGIKLARQRTPRTSYVSGTRRCVMRRSRPFGTSRHSWPRIPTRISCKRWRERARSIKCGAHHWPMFVGLTNVLAKPHICERAQWVIGGNSSRWVRRRRWRRSGTGEPPSLASRYRSRQMTWHLLLYRWAVRSLLYPISRTLSVGRPARYEFSFRRRE